jgi:flagellar basal-body rod protein FlgG
MIKALTTSATGLEAQQANIDRIANDLANVNTDGYKRGTTEFHDLMYETIKDPGAKQGASSESPVGIQKGLGVKVGASHKIFEQGPLKITNNPYDLAIEGNKGFFACTMPNTGEIVYTRTGNFKLDSQGRLGLANGALIEPPISVPSTANAVTINPSGEVKAITAEGEQVIGQIQLTNFVNNQGLKALGGNFYQRSPASGAPQQVIPGESGVGSVTQGALEASNVNVANSMIEMIGAQRAYEMNTRVMGVADKMLEATSNIVR